MTSDELQSLKDAGVFADPEVIELSPVGVVDRRSRSVYRFNAKQAQRAKEVGVSVEVTLPPAYEPYHDERGRAVLQPSIVCQLDVLGTADQTQEGAQEKLLITERALQSAQRWGQALPEHVIARWFTDNAVITSPAVDSYELLAISGIVLVAASMQLELSTEGLFARGGIAHDTAYANETFVHGKAVVQAHRLEDETAYYPRVVLAANAHGPLREALMTDVLDALIAVDHDGLAFVSYLGLVLDRAGDHSPDTVLAKHRRLIVDRLACYADSDKLRAKYGWAADYHDRFCRRHFPDQDELLIDSSRSTELRGFGFDE